MLIEISGLRGLGDYGGGKLAGMEMDPLFILLLTLLGTLTQGHELTNQQRLLSDLLTNYTTGLRPVIHHKTTTHLQMELTFSHLIELDVRQQNMKFLGWITLYWKDEFLQWDPDMYGGIAQMDISTDRIWKPDIVLYNSVDDERALTEVFPDTNALIHSNGSVRWAIPARLISTCKVVMAHYPFDRQECKLYFISWSYDSKELNATLLRDHGRFGDYIPNGQWDITAIKAERELQLYEASTEPFAKLTYTFVIQRRTVFYVFYLIIPTILFICIGVMVFILPPQSDEKVSLAVTLLLAMLVFLLIVFENIPHTDEIPFLGGFFISVIILLSLTTMMSIVVETCSDGSLVGRRPSAWVRKLFLVKIGGLLGFRKSIRMALGELHDDDIAKASFKRKSNVVYDVQKKTIKNTNVNLGSYKPSVEENDETVSQVHNIGTENSATESMQRSETVYLLHQLLTHIKDWENDKREQKTEEEKDDRIKKEWVLVAMVVDRLCLVIFGILSMGLLIWVILYGVMF